MSNREERKQQQSRIQTWKTMYAGRTVKYEKLKTPVELDVTRILETIDKVSSW